MEILDVARERRGADVPERRGDAPFASAVEKGDRNDESDEWPGHEPWPGSGEEVDHDVLFGFNGERA